jgi:type IV secretion system protein VirD4
MPSIARFIIRPVAVFGTILAGLWLATQWTAAMLDYQRQLGAPMISLLGWPVYHPWRLFEWWYAFESHAPDVFAIGGVIATFGGFMAAPVAWLFGPQRNREGRQATTFGSARWASADEIDKAGLHGDAGVMLGQFGPRYLRHAGPAHVLALAPTRSGKGVGLVIPTLLSWTGSVIVIDIKQENWALTAGWRSSFSHCLYFNPTEAHSIRYNPLLEVRKGAHEVRDAQNIADILVDPEGTQKTLNHWDRTSHELLVGAILHVLYAEADKSLNRVVGLLSDPARPFEQTLRAMMATNHLGSIDAPQPHPVVAAIARSLLDKSDNERSGVHSTALSYLSLYRDPMIARATSTCDFRISDLIDAAHPVSLYLTIPPSDLSRTRSLIRLLLNQIARRLTEGAASPPKEGAAIHIAGRQSRTARRQRHDVLLMLDEFPALGRLDFFHSALAFMAGYGIRAFIVAQSLNQIDALYGPHNAIVENCDIRISFACNDDHTAKRLSESLGTATERQLRHNYAGRRMALWLPHVSISEQDSARPLLTPDEIRRLPKSDALILVSGMAPIRARKLRYYRDGRFLARLLPPPAPTTCDLPASRQPGHDWSDQQRSVDSRIASSCIDLPQKRPDEASDAVMMPLFQWPACSDVQPADDMIMLADDLILTGASVSSSKRAQPDTAAEAASIPDGLADPDQEKRRYPVAGQPRSAPLQNASPDSRRDKAANGESERATSMAVQGADASGPDPGTSRADP